MLGQGKQLIEVARRVFKESMCIMAAYHENVEPRWKWSKDMERCNMWDNVENAFCTFLEFPTKIICSSMFSFVWKHGVCT